MKKPSALLSLIQRYSAIFIWLGIYVIFFLATSAHQTAWVSMVLCNNTIIPMIIVWAIIYYVLAPKMLHKHPALFFLLFFCLLGVVSVAATESDLSLSRMLHEKHLLQYPPQLEATIARGESQRSLLHTKYVFLLLTTMTITAISWQLNERKRLNLKQRELRAQMELKYLRAQINPHFLFNALNCIYSLTLLRDEKAPDSVMKLSEMLRYVTDDCRSDKAPLQKEIAYIRNYIDFQRIRMEQQPDITFECSMTNPSMSIPPMLFQPLVENCFKHSRVADHPDGFIHLNLVQDDKQMLFTAENSLPEQAHTANDHERTGIGLNNVRQRLELLFRGKATLEVTETETKYRIELCIKY
ncbi:MAG: GHKL domain-containing protein [Bacteroidales bacterium]|nr:GHKL domain-containing protein [Bacteroidales bacterium]